MYAYLYIIDETKIPASISGTDEEKHAKLFELISNSGARWDEFEFNNEAEFMVGLEAVDYLIGGTKILQVFTYNHSPYNLLGNSPDCGSMGYFTPKQTQDIYECLKDVVNFDFDSNEGTEVLNKYPRTTQEMANDVLYKYYSTMKDAAQKGYAVAVLFS